MTKSIHLTRRKLIVSSLAAGAGAAALVAAPGILRAAMAPRTLRMQSLNSGEKLTITYWDDGVYNEKARTRINWFMRDLRTGEVEPIHTDLLDLLWEVDQMTKSSAPIYTMSGFRSASTNAKLASTTDGVDPSSFHMRGMAIDVTQNFADPEEVFRVAKAIGKGGAGYYPYTHPFVHLDVGPVDSWVHPHMGRPDRAAEYDRLHPGQAKSL